MPPFTGGFFRLDGLSSYN